MGDPIHLDRRQLLRTIKQAMKAKLPLSVARVGNGENIVLAQYVILKEKRFMKTGTARKWPDHGSGVKLPDTNVRDEVIEALKKVDLVGILPYDDERIKTKSKFKRELTDKVFQYYHYTPKLTFDAVAFRDLLMTRSFWKLMRGKRIVILSKWGEDFRKQTKSSSKQWGFKIVKTVPIENYYGIPQALGQLENISFDVALLAAGVGSIVLSQQIAERFNKVAIDVGKGLTFIATGEQSIPKTRSLS